jgi:hypothetical protein
MSNPTNQPPLIFHTEDGQPFDIPADGMLGLLALGAVGVKAWREKRKLVSEPSHWLTKPKDEDQQAQQVENFHTQD